MKNFTKIFVLLLAFVAIVATFAVVAFAEEELTPVVKYSPDYDGSAVGTYFENNKGGFGQFVVNTSEGSADHYLAHIDGPTDGGSSNSYMTGVYSYGTAVKGTPISSYPYAVFEADVMKPGSAYSSFTFSTYIKDSGGNIKPTNGGPAADTITPYLPAESYEWAKLNVIFKYHSETVDGVLTGYLSYYMYVNGEQVYKSENAKKFTYDSEGLYSGKSESQLYLTDFRFNANTASNTGNITAFDNVKMTVYPSSYTLESIVAESYPEGYTFPYGKTYATINGVGYDDLDTAINAATEGQTLAIKTNLNEPLIVNKAIKVDINKYADGVATGEFYRVDLHSTKGYIITEEESGVYTFTKSNANVTVVFDPVCSDEECSCYEHGIGHLLNDSIIVPVGVVPEYVGEIFINEEGVVAQFLGWSYTKGGEAEELLPVTLEQAALETLYLYPVYKITKFDFCYLNTSGETSFHMADEFETILAAAIASSGIETITLYSDVEYYKSFTLTANAAFKIDLNGHMLTRINLYGAVKNYDSASGAYVEGTAKTSAVYMFTANSVSGINLTLTSSKEGAALRSVSVNGTAWYDENGKLERYEADSLTGGGLVSNYGSGGIFNYENMDVFALNIQYGAHLTSPKQDINITNCKIYKTVGSETSGVWGQDFLYLSGTVNLTAKNSLFYYPSSSTLSGNVRLLRIQGTQKCNLIFENCDIISNNPGSTILLESTNHKLTYTNCRLYNYYHESATYLGTFNENVLLGDTSDLYGRGNVADGHVIIDKAQTITYSLPTNSRVTIDSQTKLPVFDFAFDNQDISFVKQVVLYTDYFTQVTWLDENGEVIKTEEARKNELIAAPDGIKIPVGDQYRAFTNPDWLDEDGNVVSLTLGDLDAYTFKMSTELPENPVYVANITDVRFNMIYYGHFAYQLYVPVVEGVNVTWIGDYATSKTTVFIDGVEYYTANSGWPTPNTILSTKTKYVTFNVDGVEYSQSFKISGLIYSQLLLSDPATAPVEKDTILKMMAYAEQTYIFKDADGVLDETTQGTFDTFFNDYNNGNRPEMITSYPENELYTLDETFATYVDSITYSLHSNNRMTILVTLSKESVDAGYTLVMSHPTEFKSSVLNEATGTRTYYTDNAKFSSTIMSTKYTISVHDSEGKVVATTNYSLATYCNAVDSDMADALYTFGKALEISRAYLSTK